jgi:hypothetical protein
VDGVSQTGEIKLELKPWDRQTFLAVAIFLSKSRDGQCDLVTGQCACHTQSGMLLLL